MRRRAARVERAGVDYEIRELKNKGEFGDDLQSLFRRRRLLKADEAAKPKMLFGAGTMQVFQLEPLSGGRRVHSLADITWTWSARVERSGDRTAGEQTAE